MKTTAAPLTAETVAATSRLWLWRPGFGAGLVAAAATTAVVALARAGDIPVAVGGEQIPLAGFPQFTLVGALIGVLLARVLARRASEPRRAFLRTTVALTALSLVPDVIAESTTASKLVLIATHLVAAAIIVPMLARPMAARSRAHP